MNERQLKAAQERAVRAISERLEEVRTAQERLSLDLADLEDLLPDELRLLADEASKQVHWVTNPPPPPKPFLIPQPAGLQ